MRVVTLMPFVACYNTMLVSSHLLVCHGHEDSGTDKPTSRNGKHAVSHAVHSLQRHGLDVRMSQLFKVGEARPGAVRPPAAPRPSLARPAAPRLLGPKPPPPNSTATLASVSDSTILEHLDKQ